MDNYNENDGSMIQSEQTPLLPVDSSISSSSNSRSEVPHGDADCSSTSEIVGKPEPPESAPLSLSPSPPSSTSVVTTGRSLLLLVAFLYGSLSVSLRMVYARPGPPAASILSATRGWMTVLCLLPVILWSRCCKSRTLQDPPDYSRASFYAFCLELAVFNFGTQGLLNIGLLTTESARSAFFTQLSVVITPVLAATIGLCRKKAVVVKSRIWMACFLALFGLYVLSSKPGSRDIDIDIDTNNSGSEETTDAAEGFSWSLASIAVAGSGILQSLSFGDWCCLGSAFCWSYYIYRLSDWGNRYDEAQTMFVKNIFMAILYTSWTAVSYFLTTMKATADNGNDIADPFEVVWGNETDSYEIDTDASTVAGTTGFYLWEGWRDPIALSILFYTALSSGAISDILQQKAQAHVSAAESNVILSLEPVFAALLGLGLLAEIPSLRECFGGAFIVLASVLAST